MNDAIRTSTESAKVCAAIVNAQAKILPAKKDSTNPHFKSKFASLQAVFESFQPAVVANKLMVMQAVTEAPAGIHITTRLIHESGEWVEAGPAFFPVSKMDAQGYGSACTYGKRYSVCAMLGVVADDDDDGNKAVGRDEPTRAPSGSARGAMQDVYDAMDEESKKWIGNIATKTVALLRAEGPLAAVDFIEGEGLTNEDKMSLWFLLDSTTRSSIKKEQERRLTKTREAA